MLLGSSCSFERRLLQARHRKQTAIKSSSKKLVQYTQQNQFLVLFFPAVFLFLFPFPFPFSILFKKKNPSSVRNLSWWHQNHLSQRNKSLHPTFIKIKQTYHFPLFFLRKCLCTKPPFDVPVRVMKSSATQVVDGAVSGLHCSLLPPF